MKWEAEGEKGLLWMAIKKVCAKEKLLVRENGNFFADSEERYVQKKFLYVKTTLSEVRKVFC